MLNINDDESNQESRMSNVTGDSHSLTELLRAIVWC